MNFDLWCSKRHKSHCMIIFTQKNTLLKHVWYKETQTSRQQIYKKPFIPKNILQWYLTTNPNSSKLNDTIIHLSIRVSEPNRAAVDPAICCAVEITHSHLQSQTERMLREVRVCAGSAAPGLSGRSAEIHCGHRWCVFPPPPAEWAHPPPADEECDRLTSPPPSPPWCRSTGDAHTHNSFTDWKMTTRHRTIPRAFCWTYNLFNWTYGIQMNID